MAPAAARRSAILRPMPPLAPVTRAMRSSKVVMARARLGCGVDELPPDISVQSIVIQGHPVSVILLAAALKKAMPKQRGRKRAQ